MESAPVWGVDGNALSEERDMLSAEERIRQAMQNRDDMNANADKHQVQRVIWQLMYAVE